MTAKSAERNKNRGWAVFHFLVRFSILLAFLAFLAALAVKSAGNYFFPSGAAFFCTLTASPIFNSRRMRKGPTMTGSPSLGPLVASM